MSFDFIDSGIPGVGQTPTLYKLDSLGKLRTWCMQLEYETGGYRTLAGLADGKQATSGWTMPLPKSQATSADQGEFEVRAAVKHQLDREYHDSPDTVGTAKMIEPMLAKTYDKFPGAGTFDPKFDGIRCIADINGLWTRQGQPIVAVPHLHAVLTPAFERYPDAIFDGELYNHDLREDFGAISSIVRKKNPTADQFAAAEKIMQYHIYDLVTGTGNRGERKRQAWDILRDTDVPLGWVHVVMGERITSELELRQAYGEAIGNGYEGGIFAPDGYEYELGRRSKGLLKMKDFITKEFKLLRLEEGKGNWAGAIKRAILQNDGGECGEFGAGIRGSYAAGKALMGAVVTDKSTATVRYFMRSPDGVPRFPVVVDIQLEGRND